MPLEAIQCQTDRILVKKGFAKQSKMAQRQNNNISTPCSSLALILSIFAIMFAICLNVLMSQGLFIQGVNWIYAYQQAQPQLWIRIAYNLLSLVGGPLGVGFCIGIYFIAVKRKLKFFVHVAYFLYCTHLMALLKQALQGTRPIWWDSRIQQWDWLCPNDSGTPSGHATAVILLNEPIVSDSIGYLGYHLGAVPLSALVILVAFSRLYLGVHSPDQLLFGIVLGFGYIILFKFVFQQCLYKLFWGIFTSRKYLYYRVGAAAILNLITIGYPILFFQMNSQHSPLLFKDMLQINATCGVQSTSLDVQTRMMSSAAIGCSAFGILYGFWVLGGSVQHRKYMLGHWKHGSVWRLMVGILVYGVCGGVAYIFAALSEFVAEAPMLKYLLMVLAIELAGFNFVFVACVLSIRLKAVQFSAEGGERTPKVQTLGQEEMMLRMKQNPAKTDNNRLREGRERKEGKEGQN